MKIRYNIAEKKKINKLRFIITVFLLAVFSSAFVFAGLYTWNQTSKRFQKEKDQLKEWRMKADNKSREEENFKRDVEKIKAKWKRKIKFTNDLIEGKKHPYLQKLGIIEEILPVGVYVFKITLSAEEGPKIKMIISAVSSSKLMEAYSKFSKYNLVIQKEARFEGLFRTTLDIKIEVENENK